VPLRLVTGKALDEKRSYITIEYKDGSSDIFEEGKVSVPEGQRRLDAYERVLLEAIAGRKELFTSSAEVIRAWEILAPLQYAWEMASDAPIAYAPGAHFSTLLSH
jgi:glucose-6-phosphate 1-dehydrogenase